MRDTVINSIDELINLGNAALNTERRSHNKMIAPDYLSGPKYREFKSKLLLFSERFLKEHPLYNAIQNDLRSASSIRGTENIVQHLKTIKEDDIFLEQLGPVEKTMENGTEIIEQMKQNHGGKPKVFVVYGHDEDVRNEVKQFLLEIECEPVILQNEPSGGLTIIEKIEAYSNVIEFAIVIYSACDEGRLLQDIATKEGKKNNEYQKRARQNVVFEHGYMIAKLTRQKVVALIENGVETPGDVDGVVYVSMSDDGWRQSIIKEMDNAGIAIDIKKALYVSSGKIKAVSKIDSSSAWGSFIEESSHEKKY